MRNTLGMVAVLLIPASLAAQAPDPQRVRSRVQAIREMYSTVQSALDGLELQQKEYYEMGGDGTVLVWRRDGAPVKLAVEFNGDGAGGLTEYFFHDGELFFVFFRWETFQIWPDQTPDDYGVTEYRYYFDGTEIVRILEKSYENDNRQVERPWDEEFSVEAAFLLSEAEMWLEFAAVPDRDLDAFTDARQ